MEGGINRIVITSPAERNPRRGTWFDSRAREKRLERVHKRQRCEVEPRGELERKREGQREESGETGIKRAASRIRPTPRFASSCAPAAAQPRCNTLAELHAATVHLPICGYSRGMLADVCEREWNRRGHAISRRIIPEEVTLWALERAP